MGYKKRPYKKRLVQILGPYLVTMTLWRHRYNNDTDQYCQETTTRSMDYKKHLYKKTSLIWGKN